MKLARRTFLSSAMFGSLTAGLNLDILPIAHLATATANEPGLTFLFQGDSITDGNRGRSADPNHIMGHGYAFTIASRIGADFPEQQYLFYNRGISGNTVGDLQKRWQTDTLDLKPDVLSVLIGINDTAAAVNQSDKATTVDQFETGYRQLLADCQTQKPDTLFVLGVPFCFPVGKLAPQWDVWHKETLQRAERVKKLASDFNAVLVDYPAVFDKAMTHTPAAYWIWDGIHPTVPAHELMAREWLKQVSTRLTFLKKYKRSY